MELLKDKLYTPEAIARLVDAVKARLRERRPAGALERERLQVEAGHVRRRLDGLRRFIEQGDVSSSVRTWLADAEQEENRLKPLIQNLEGETTREPLRVHRAAVEGHLRELATTLDKGGQRARQALHADIECNVIHPVRPDAAKPFARAEIVTTGKGLLDRVAFVVAGAGFEPATFGL